MSQNVNEIINIILSYRNGKGIEFKKKEDNSKWSKLEEPFWNFEEYDYRVSIEKPSLPYTFQAIKVLVDFCRSHSGCGDCSINPLYGGKDKTCPLYVLVAFSKRLVKEIERDYEFDKKGKEERERTLNQKLNLKTIKEEEKTKEVKEKSKVDLEQEIKEVN